LCNKVEIVSYHGLIQPNTIPTQKWKEVSMDFITRLPLSKGKDAIFEVVDHLTKYVHFIPLTIKFTTFGVDLFFQHVYKLHGLPHFIISNRYPKFLSDF
jgi:hypothetical protein